LTDKVIKAIILRDAGTVTYTLQGIDNFIYLFFWLSVTRPVDADALAIKTPIVSLLSLKAKQTSRSLICPQNAQQICSKMGVATGKRRAWMVELLGWSKSQV
jgi:hypothetical protein